MGQISMEITRQPGSVLGGNQHEQQFLSARNWPFGAALAMMVMEVMLIGMTALFAIAARRRRAAQRLDRRAGGAA